MYVLLSLSNEIAVKEENQKNPLKTELIVKKLILIFSFFALSKVEIMGGCRQTNIGTLTGKCTKSFIGDYTCETVTASKDCSGGCNCPGPIV
jgi:hypothetical protein